MINLYEGDSLEAMRSIPDNFYDLAIVDPPYGGNDAIGTKNANKANGVGFKHHKGKRTDYKLFENVAPPGEYFQQLKRISKKQIIWGVNFYKDTGGVDLTGGRIVWDKKGTAFGRAELAYYSHSKSVQIVEIVWNGMLQHDMQNKETRIHATQKPIKLYEWLLLNYAEAGYKIIDTHLGSASIACACHNLGFDLDAWEICPDHFANGTKRFELHKQAHAPLFTPEVGRATSADQTLMEFEFLKTIL